MRERRRDYELMFIISPLRSSEEEITATISRVHQAITVGGGEVTATEHTPPWGRRKFAYPIRDYAEGEASRRAFNEGYYVLTHFSLPVLKIPDVERTLKLSDAILRYLLTLIEHKGQATPAATSLTLSHPTGARASADDSDLDDGDDADLDEDIDDDMDDDDDEV
jgi:small subunit ribosomal protein S6